MIPTIFNRPAFIEKDFLPTEWSRDMVLALRIYIFLKILIASISLASDPNPFSENLGTVGFFQIYCWSIIFYSFIQYITTTNREQPLKNVTFLFFALDISLITLITSTQTADTSTTPLLMYICIGSASMILRLRLGIVLAIFACIITIFEYYQRHEFSNTQINVLGIQVVVILFSCYFFALLARRARSAEIKTKIETARSTALIDINHELVQNLDMGIIVLDGNGLVETCNPAAANLFNKNDIHSILSINDLSPKLKHLWEDWINRKISDKTRFTYDQTKTDIDVLFSKLGQEGKFSKITLFTETLLREQAQRYSLERMGRMASAIAHEIRNPLTSITTASELLQKNKEPSLNIQKPISIISRNTARINHIIEDILAISRSKQVDLQEINLCTWIYAFLDEYLETKDQTKKYFIEVSNEQKKIDKLIVNFSASHLKQILTNLCDNALLHGVSSANDPIVIKLFELQNKIFLEVFSPGKPIEKEKATKIFEPFYTTKANQGGTGLGLYLCQQICELNLGVISHESYKSGNGFKISFFSKILAS